MDIQEWNMFKSGCLDEYEAWLKKRGADQIGRAVAALKSMADTCSAEQVRLEQVDTGDFEEGTAEQADKAASDFKGVVVALQMAPKDGSLFINFASAVTAAVDVQRKTRAWQAAPESKQKSSFRDHLTTSLRALKSAIIDMDAEQAETTVFMKSFDWENVDTKGIDAMVGKVRRILSEGQKKVLESLVGCLQKQMQSATKKLDKVPEIDMKKKKQTEKTFTEHLQKGETSAKHVRDCKRALDAGTVKVVALHAEWGEPLPELVPEVVSESKVLSNTCESLCLVFALLTNLRAETVDQPSGASFRSNVMNIYTSLKQPDTLLKCPDYLVKEAEQLLLSFGDTKAACEEIMGSGSAPADLKSDEAEPDMEESKAGAAPKKPEEAAPKKPEEAAPKKKPEEAAPNKKQKKLQFESEPLAAPNKKQKRGQPSAASAESAAADVEASAKGSGKGKRPRRGGGVVAD